MVYTTMCVSEEWNSKYRSNIEHFAKDSKLFVLTDYPETYKNSYTVNYKRKDFSYFEKVKFIFNTVKSLSTRVTYIDANKLTQYNTNIHFEDHAFYTGQVLSIQHLYKYFMTPSTLTDIGLIFDKIGIKNLNIKYPREHILSIPYSNSVEEILNDLEIIQPYLESYYNKVPKTQYLKRYSETGVGYAEGWAIVAISIKYGFEIKSLDWKKKSLI